MFLLIMYSSLQDMSFTTERTERPGLFFSVAVDFERSLRFSSESKWVSWSKNVCG